MNNNFRDTKSFGDKLKNIESANETKLVTSLPVYARLDGKKFSKFTNGMKKPYDDSMVDLMTNSSKKLVEMTGATMAYTQSDEISLVWIPNENTWNTNIDFDGRKSKLIGELSGLASSAFMYDIMNDSSFEYYDYGKKLPRFDCRIFNCSYENCAEFIHWRQIDCIKNSVSLCAQKHFSHKSLDGVSSKKRKEMLRDKGHPWEDSPDYFKYGIFVSKFTHMMPIHDMPDVPQHIKDKTDKDHFVERKLLKSYTMPSFSTIDENFYQTLFNESFIDKHKIEFL